MDKMELFKMLIPVIILQIGLLGYTLIDLFKNGVRNLNKAAWVVIILFVNLLGPICYLIFGRGDGTHADD